MNDKLVEFCESGNGVLKEWTFFFRWINAIKYAGSLIWNSMNLRKIKNLTWKSGWTN
jgi:hypothetical protein